ncbi:MAG: hypothetical protein QOH93_1663 [Chloroflexia bacterium]|jgi:uncharacterized protein YndB with AHSA1/START domain|nr:hypothetical protein [Chloroflexia bacterium]
MQNVVRKYKFLTVWKLDAPIDRVWEAIHDTDEWPRWWKYVQAVGGKVEGIEDGVGSVRSYTWSSALPYKLTFHMRTTRAEKPYVLEGEAQGELTGTGRWDLSTADGVTTVRYLWEVDMAKPFLNAIAPVARPLFVWNHNKVMQAGGEGLARLLGARLLAHAEK